MTLRYEFTQQAITEQGFQAEICLTNTGERPVKLGCLYFSLARILQPADVTGGELRARDGDLHAIAFDSTLEPGDELRCQLNNPRDRMVKFTDWPYGVYAESPLGELLPMTIQEPPVNWRLSPLAGHSREALQELAVVHTVVPQPQSIALGAQQFTRPVTLGWKEPPAALKVTSADLAAWSEVLAEFTPVVAVSASGWPVSFVQQDMASGSYRLQVTAQGGVIQTADGAGVHAALASLVQWLAGGQVQEVVIEDVPRFGYRGLHLDVVRHFVPVDQVCKVLRLAALYKLNQFHWHLTDDEAWRLEIRAYPALTEQTAVRGRGRTMPPQMGTGDTDHGGFYTQDEVRQVVALANSLGINVMPEIDVPGHARALLRALPELQEPADESVYRSVQHYSDNVLNPALPATWTVLQTILDEVMELFPSPDIHLGSDEVPVGVWQRSPAAIDKAQSLGLADVTALHGWFMRGLEDHLLQRGRRAAGWEEITVGQAVSRRTTVFSWQGVEAGQKAAALGYPVVMTPAQYCYLDLSYNRDQAEPGYYWAGETDLAKAYGYEPLADWSGDGVGTNLVRGLQACVWSELLAESYQLEYMLLPRLLAVAERAWSSADVRDMDDFVRRCLTHRALWQRAGWYYRAEALGW
ncbi:beta-N-acetylhexosaminidase [Salinispirillum sp. LH 10-3-1]|uniref:beta-N-acetylhexosaminidase n=1 Tax=Salinispirillum sp. LH 10-3-1 TaxID=2952525 RepID=A0AB38YHX1_9GAMM